MKKGFFRHLDAELSHYMVRVRFVTDWLPVEVVISSPGKVQWGGHDKTVMDCMKQARAWALPYSVVDSEVVSHDELCARAKELGKEYYKYRDEYRLYLMEQWVDAGDDGHTNYVFRGWRVDLMRMDAPDYQSYYKDKMKWWDFDCWNDDVDDLE